ncbi:MAG: glycosyltransferase, partial [Propionibacteriaceae bacterium]|nr:glycosyltransferase [Propionibacteriaceae bacterium]
MRVLMLVATSVVTDTRVMREALTLRSAGHTVHIIGRSVPEDFVPGNGITVSSVGTSSVFRSEGGVSLSGRKLSLPVRAARWAMLPQHRRSSFGRWAEGALEDGRRRDVDVVHAHDFTALEAGATLAREKGAALVYDSHELWSGMPREYRPTPLADRADLAKEAELGGQADAVITVGDGVARALHALHGWDNIWVVRNTFPLREVLPAVPERPQGLVYAGRVGAFRELEVIAAASRSIDLPIEICGPSDDTWLTTFDPGRTTVLPALPLDEASEHLSRAGLSLVTHSNRWANHRLAMPNKLFHAVSLGVPVVATDVGELGAIVRKHHLGTLYEPGNVDALIQATGEAVARYERLRSAVLAAREELS